MKIHKSVLSALSVSLLISVSAGAQQINGVPGSPSATMTIEGAQLPAPPQKFGGHIEREATKSKPYWPARIVPPKSAPNVLLIMTDDAGFGVASTLAASSRRRRSIALRKKVCATQISIRPRCVRQRAPQLSRAAITTRSASA